MQWLNRLLGVPVVEFKPLRIEGEPLQEFTLENWKAIGGMFLNVPGLKEAVNADFEDTLAKLKAVLLTPEKSHLELIRLGQKVVDLHALLSMPKTAVTKANEILSEMERDQRGPEPKAPSTQNVM